MSATPQQARKEIFTRLDAVWLAQAPALVAPASPPAMRYQGVEGATLPGATKYWARASADQVTTRQSAFIMSGEPGQSAAEFETRGLVVVQIFAPMSEQDSYSKGELLAHLAQRVFMASNTPSQVWFRNPRILTVPNDGTWFRWNVFTDYQFNQVRDPIG